MWVDAGQAAMLGLVWTTSIAGRSRTTRTMVRVQAMEAGRPELREVGKAVHCGLQGLT